MTMKLPGPLSNIKQGAAIPPAPGATVAGGFRTLTAGQEITVADVTSSDEQAWSVVSTATACTGAGADDATKARHQVMLRITSGTAKGGHTEIVAAGREIVVVGSSVQVVAFMRRQDAQPLVPTMTSNVVAFIAPGGPDAEGYPSQWIEPAPAPSGETGLGATYEGLISSIPGTLKSLFVTNFGSAEGTICLLDQAKLVVGSVDANLHNSPIVFSAIVPARGTASWDLPRGRRFFQGLSWGVSSSSPLLSLDATQLFRVDAEIGYR